MLPCVNSLLFSLHAVWFDYSLSLLPLLARVRQLRPTQQNMSTLVSCCFRCDPDTMSGSANAASWCWLSLLMLAGVKVTPPSIARAQGGAETLWHLSTHTCSTHTHTRTNTSWPQILLPSLCLLSRVCVSVWATYNTAFFTTKQVQLMHCGRLLAPSHENIARSWDVCTVINRNRFVL